MASESDILSTIILVVVVKSCLFDAASIQSVISANFELTVQGINQCPDPSYADSWIVSASRSQLDCVRNCRFQENCIYFGYRKDTAGKLGTCSLYMSTPDRLLTTQNCIFMGNTQAFKGTLPTATVRIDPNGCSLPFQYNFEEYNKCMSVAGIATPQCITPNGTFADCIVPAGFTAKPGEVNMTLGTSYVPLPCINNWIILMNRFDGSVSFDRPWADYKNGFGNIRTSEFWIGNENIHLYTNRHGTSCRLRVEFQGLTSGKWFYVEYDTFLVDSETNGYAIHLTGYVGNGGDSLTNTSVNSIWYHNGMKFSTSDADNDQKQSGSCVSQYPSGFWFNNCWWTCLTCVYGTQNFAWYTLNDYGYESQGLLQATRMMIRRNYYV